MSDKQEHHEEKKPTEIENHDTENDYHCQKSESQASYVSDEESQTMESQTEASESKEKDSVSQKNSAETENQTGTSSEPFYTITDESSDSSAAERNESNESRQCSCSYTPPYYVPNFTEAATNSSSFHSARKPSKSASAVAILCVIGILITFSVGSLSGYWFLYARQGQNFNDDKIINVTKNDGSIRVNERTDSTGYSDLSVSEVVELVADSVVEITTSQVQTDLFMNSYVTSGAGSGVLIGESQAFSYIITNQHVIEDADKILVRLKNGTEYEASVVCSDADVDIAVLTVRETGLSYATMGSSASLKVGESVVAIGNPLGELGGTVTDGIISALDRNIIVDGHPMTLLQTNAAINPGNSGGGVFNMAGELIGIVNAKQSDTGIEGLGFAIPIDVAWSAANDMIQYQMVTGKIVLGFTVKEYTSAFRLQHGSQSYVCQAGVYIVSTERSDLSQYDRVKSINGQNIEDIADFYTVVNQLQKGDRITMVVSRQPVGEQHTITIDVTVTEAPRS